MTHPYPASTSSVELIRSTTDKRPLSGEAALSSPLDDFLSGRHPSGFNLAIPCSRNKDGNTKYERKHGVGAKENGSGSVDGEPIRPTVSELTLMTYRAELMKQVSRLMMYMHAFRNSSPLYFFSSSLNIIRQIYTGNQY